MANTLKFGNGQWATKEGSVLAYNSENNNFKPLPFDFTRASTATYVDSDGLIKTSGNGEPRIDYTDNTDGALLLEPSRTNVVTYSEDFSQWQGTGVNITANDVISPDGSLNADKVESTDAYYGKYIQPTVSSGVDYTASIFVKNATDSDSITFRLLLGTNDTRYIFNTSDLTVTAVSGYTNGFVDSNIENYGNGWYRCSLTTTSNGTSSVFAIYPKILTNSDTESANLFGAQLELGSYATSYIPTSGSAVTRVGDVCNNGANEQVIGQTEGVLYAEIAGLADDGTSRRISLSDSSTSDTVEIILQNTGRVDYQVKSGNSFQGGGFFNLIQTEYHKIAVKYKSNDLALWVDGYEQSTDNSASTPIGLVELAFDDGNNGSDFYGKIKEIRVYNTALTDAELQALTS